MFPYAIARNKFHVELVDLVNLRIETLKSASNGSGLQPKLGVTATPEGIDFFYVDNSEQRSPKLMQVSTRH
jgi:hypothetical protein